jgi:TorA maturation chaperone TorD
MTKSGVDRAVQAAGGASALARALGISQPAISTWKRIPAERVLAIESVTGISRSELRPDLYPRQDNVQTATRQDVTAIDPLDEARAREFELIGALIWRAPTRSTLDVVGDIKGDASGLGMAHMELAEAARLADPVTLRDDFFRLFIGVGRAEFLPYASYYLTGFLHEKPLAAVREDLARLGLARAERASEPEDHIAILCDVMAALLRGEVAANGIDAETFFRRHILPWAPRLFADLEVQEMSRFYQIVGRLGRLFIAIEDEAYGLSS